MRPVKGDVCVTGGRGFVGSHITRELLSRGYNVRVTARNPEDATAVAHLKQMEAEFPGQSVRLFYADLLLDDSFLAAFHDCVGVVHTASPFFHNPENAQVDLIIPAVKGTLNVLDCAHKAGVSRVVVTSSTAAMFHPPDNHRAHGPYTEADWNTRSNEEEWPYFLSKVQAERAAWGMAMARGVELVSVNPGLVLGPLLAHTTAPFPTSLASIQRLITGAATASSPTMRAGGGGVALVHARDVARAHVEALERKEAAGQRYLCVAQTASWRDIVERLHRIRPDTAAKVEAFGEVAAEDMPQFDTTKIRTELGIDSFADLDTILKDTVDGLVARKLLPPLQ